ncbi:hypothetical protein SAMN00120144_1600 [Hymenobacter roseosalivarius DSM 11622]|uniref:Uncharacterized protein n=1 Tax=Hymenobacter roseosalivarius DSM 11622 TaxID=645990 RepID=A0A1W1VXY9_9BACT|nr:hypothetical protein SAMN00120144_1600 [Hymenobacter roseosalivarius DSM 11622]
MIYLKKQAAQGPSCAFIRPLDEKVGLKLETLRGLHNYICNFIQRSFSFERRICSPEWYSGLTRSVKPRVSNRQQTVDSRSARARSATPGYIYSRLHFLYS